MKPPIEYRPPPITHRIDTKAPVPAIADLKVLQTRLADLLPPDERKQLQSLFARLERSRQTNAKAQQAHRDRKKANG